MREHAVVFGDESPLVGILTEPDAGLDAGAPVFLFLNAGLSHRVGPNRLYVTVARKLAEIGLASLRFDFSGIGDSPASPSPAVMEERAGAEVIEAMNFLGQSAGVQAFVPVGLCWGANVGFALATSDDRIVGGVLINASVIPSSHTKEQMAEAWKRAQAHHHGSRLADWRGWRRVFAGRSDLLGLCRSTVRLARRALGVEHSPQLPVDLGSLPEIDRRGVELLAVYSEGDLGLELLMTHVGRVETLHALSRFQLEILTETDHILTPVWAQRRIETLVLDWARRRLVTAGSPRRGDAGSTDPQEVVL